MDKLLMCRICLVQNVSMYVVGNRHLQELYEKLTDIPFVTEDSRPILACFFCCAKLKQCYRFMRKCLEAEELFAQMMNEGYEPNTLINQDHLEFFSGFIKSPTENISIVDEFQKGSIAIKEESIAIKEERIAIKKELPAVFEELGDIIEPKEEHQNDELEPEYFDNICLDVPPHHSESDLEDDVPLMEFKTEGEEEQEVSTKKRRAREMTSATDVKEPKLEDTITAERTEEEKSDSKVIWTTQKRTSRPGTYFKEPYKCDQRSFNRVKNIMQDARTLIGEKPNCDICQRSFSHKVDLIQHIRTHTDEKPYKCDVCQRRFSKKGNLSNHILIHTDEKPHKCDVCQRGFSQKGHLSQHILIHTSEKPYKCDVCQLSFNVKGSLLRHIRIHTGEKPYKCDICQRSFSINSNLTKHIRIHTGEKPHKCNICQRSFTIKSNLSKHIRIHTGEKPYKCDVCQLSFSETSHLSQHVRIHTGEKPFKCDVCQRSFSQTGHLTKHIRIHTREKPC